MDTDDMHMTVKDLKRFEKEKQFMASKIADLEAQLESGRIKLDEFSAMQSVHTQELIDAKQQLSEADNRLKLNKEVGAKFERLAKDREIRIDELEREIRKANETIQQHEEKIEALELQLEQVGSGRQDLIDQNALVNKLKKQLIQAIAAASREQNDVQNALQTTAMMLQEIRIEYEKFTETSRAEFHEHLDAKDSELEALRQRLERGNQVHFENAKHMLLEQKELVDALKNQFDEYRRTAEHIFLTEAKKMEGKLSAQSLKHELELKYTIRAKDLHFRRMVAAKDAKIMNLIEGTDLQAFLVKHEIELDHLRRQHERDLEIVKEEVEEAQTKQFQQLQNKVAVQELDIEKANQNVKHLETKLGETLELVKQSKQEMISKDAAHVAQMNEMQDQVRLSQQMVDDLTRAHETLRHRIVRLKLKLNGEGRDDLGSLLKRLTTETHRLSGLFENLSAKQKATNEMCDKLRAERDRYREITVALKHDLLERRKNIEALTKAFETSLNSNLRRQMGTRSRLTEINPDQFITNDAQDAVVGMEPPDDIHPTLIREKDHERILDRLRCLTHGIPTLQSDLSTSPSIGKFNIVEVQTMTRAMPFSDSVGRALDMTRPLYQYREPHQLSRMAEDQVLVRHHTIDDIQLGLKLISQFKALTRQYRNRDNNTSLIRIASAPKSKSTAEQSKLDSETHQTDPDQDNQLSSSILADRALYKKDADEGPTPRAYQSQDKQCDSNSSNKQQPERSYLSSHVTKLEFDQEVNSAHQQPRLKRRFDTKRNEQSKSRPRSRPNIRTNILGQSINKGNDR